MLNLSKHLPDGNRMQTNEMKISNRREVLSLATVFSVGSLSWAIFPNDVRAERTLTSVTESYNRYVPRMEKGFRYLNDTMPTQILDGDNDIVISEISAEKGTTISAMKGTMRVSCGHDTCRFFIIFHYSQF